MLASPQPFVQRARTKIVATVGPACSQQNQLAELVSAGVDIFRVNMAHADQEEAATLLDSIRQVERQMQQPLAVLIDLAGPKMRLGEIPGGVVDCLPEREYTILPGSQTDEPDTLCTSYPSLFDDLAVGDRVMLSDGTVTLSVVSKQDGRLHCRCLQGGLVRSRQGINLPGVAVSAPTLGEQDREVAVWAADAGVDFVSLSFIRSADDVHELRTVLAQHNSQAAVVAKIEKREALDELPAVVKAADAVMVARGDLGVELTIAELPVVQKRIIAACRKLGRPVIVATQMLDSMQRGQRPTRAEATDVANAILDGSDACMLSAETAVGRFPRLVVETMNEIALATESQLADLATSHTSQQEVDVHEITSSVVHGAGIIASRLNARLMVVASHSGATALALANLRMDTPTIGVSDVEATLRKMCLYWGVTPLLELPVEDPPGLVRDSIRWGLGVGCLQPGDRLVVVGGSHLAQGIHDTLLVHEVT